MHRLLFLKSYVLNLKSGVAALPVMVLIGGITMVIAVTGLLVVYTLGQGAFGAKFSAEAFSAAQSGIDDALIKIIRNKNFSSPTPYAVSVGARTATVTVCKDFKSVSSSCDTANDGKDEITSVGSAFTKSHKIRAIISVIPLTGEIQVDSVAEISL